MFNFLKDRSTDWKHIEISRLAWFLTFLGFNAVAAWLLYRNSLTLDQYSTNAAVINGGGAAGTTVKSVAQAVTDMVGKAKAAK